MIFKLLADLVLILHFVFILFVVLGAFLVLYRHRIAYLHIPMVLWSAVVNLTPLRCPLTPLENYFRLASGETGYEGGFIRHYINPIVYPQDLGIDMALLLGVGVIAWNLLIYLFIVFRMWKRRVHS